MADVETELAAALAALASEDDERALEHLVAAWGAARAEPLIALVDALASRVEPRHPALGGRNADERYRAFRDTAARGRQADLARLVALLPRLAYGDLSTALDTLLYDWRPTPRLRALLEAVRLPGSGDRLDELRTVHAVPGEAQLSERASGLLAELARVVTPADDAGAALLAQVHTDPAADAPRLVYADWAAARGDPHGELIALQYARRTHAPAPAAVRREKELIELYARRWLAPIWHAIRPHSLRFERGFLAAAEVEPFAVIAPHPAWSTVTALELAYHEVLPIDAFPALRELRNVTPKLLAQIATAPTKLVHLGLAAEPGPARVTPVLPALVDGRAFPALTSLGVWGMPEDWSWIWDTPVGVRLERLEVVHPANQASPWLQAPLPSRIRELCMRDQINELTLVREGDAWPVARVVCRVAARDVLAWSPHAFQWVPANSLRELRFVLPHRAKSDTVQRLEQSARRQHALARFGVDVDPFV